MRRLLAAAALAFGLTFSGAPFAATEHSHDRSAPAQELRLNNGQKWATDDPLRRGMSEIHSALTASLPRINQGQLTKSDFSALADQIQAQVDFIVTNCKLPEDADFQLHIVLTKVLEGIVAMKAEADQTHGLLAVLEALNAYGDHFDQPGWTTLKY